MSEKIRIICGHYGSGKTNVAVNLALKYISEGKSVSLTDLDIVNPYFRASDDRRILEDAGVRCIIPEFAGSNLDLPTIPPEVYSIFSSDELAILDVGGDDAGAIALGMFKDMIISRGYEMYCVVNMYRPLISTPEKALENMRDIENTCHLKFTGIINNSNLGEDTDEGVIEDSFAYADEIARLSSLPLIFDSHLDKYTPKSDRKTLKIKNYTNKIW